MSILLLAVALFLALLLIPVGLPGTWVMVVAGVAYSFLVPGAGIGAIAVIGCTTIALVAELIEFGVTGRYTRKYGGSSRGAWGAIIGGVVGAVVGLPVPVVGSVAGALAGSFVGALVAEYSGGAAHIVATRAATGAVIGRAVAIALKAGTGCVIAAWFLAAAIFQ